MINALPAQFLARGGPTLYVEDQPVVVWFADLLTQGLSLDALGVLQVICS